MYLWQWNETPILEELRCQVSRDLNWFLQHRFVITELLSFKNTLHFLIAGSLEFVRYTKSVTIMKYKLFLSFENISSAITLSDCETFSGLRHRPYSLNMFSSTKPFVWMCVCLSMCFRLTDEICLASVDGVLQLIGGDAELVFWCPVNGDGVMGGGAQLIPDGWRVGRYMWREKKNQDLLLSDASFVKIKKTKE